MFKTVIITSSDSASKGEREDLSGVEIQNILSQNGEYEVVRSVILPDDKETLKNEMIKIADSNEAVLVLTTGGTGFSQRDNTPEATEEACEKMVPGIAEAMRAYSMSFTKRAMLSRATSGIRKSTLVVNLPGSPKAVRECLEYILPELKHGIEILTGEASNCARK